MPCLGRPPGHGLSQRDEIEAASRSGRCMTVGGWMRRSSKGHTHGGRTRSSDRLRPVGPALTPDFAEPGIDFPGLHYAFLSANTTSTPRGSGEVDESAGVDQDQTRHEVRCPCRGGSTVSVRPGYPSVTSATGGSVHPAVVPEPTRGLGPRTFRLQAIGHAVRRVAARRSDPDQEPCCNTRRRAERRRTETPFETPAPPASNQVVAVEIERDDPYPDVSGAGGGRALWRCRSRGAGGWNLPSRAGRPGQPGGDRR